MGCCDKKPVKNRKRACPACETMSFAVGMRTLLHHVQFPENQNLPDEDYFFCATVDCKVAYFSRLGVIEKDKLRIFQAPRKDMLCYCFDISIASYQMALADGEATRINDFILEQTKNALCACEVKNPSARCCWGNLQKMEKLYAS